MHALWRANLGALPAHRHFQTLGKVANLALVLHHALVLAVHLLFEGMALPACIDRVPALWHGLDRGLMQLQVSLHGSAKRADLGVLGYLVERAALHRYLPCLQLLMR